MKRYMTILTCVVVVMGLKQAFAQEVLFSDGFESGTLDPMVWQAHPGTPDGVVEVISNDVVPQSGIFGVRLGKSRDGDETTNALDLHLDLSGREQVSLSFWIRSNHDSTNPQDGIWFSDDGGQTFIKVFDFNPSDWRQNAYGQFPPFDVDQLAVENGLSLTEQFIIRFQQHGDRDFTGPGSNNSHGFFLDNVRVTAGPVTYTTLPFEDGFEEGMLGNAWRWGDPRLSLPEGFLLPGGVVAVSSDNAARTGVFGVAMGRRTDGEETTNALDLHLDLLQHEQVELRFWIFSNNDVSNTRDGIWFSDDGGATFRKVFEYDLTPGEWLERIVPVDALAAEVGMTLTDQFIIRFQQHGDRDFTGPGSNNSHGFFLDDVSVHGTFVPPGTCNGFTATITGTHGDDVLTGTPGDDVIDGLSGDDVIVGLGGNDIICGGKGVDVVFGGAGNDQLFGGLGDDVLQGEEGDDSIFGEAGDDFLFGGLGIDTLDGGDGDNIMVQD